MRLPFRHCRKTAAFHFFIRSLPVLFVCAAGCKPEPPPPIASQPATKPAETTTPATAPTTKPIEATYLDRVRKAYPTLPATQPLAFPLALRDSAHIVLHDPLYLDEQGHLWITHDSGADAERLARQPAAGFENEHVIKERVRFVWWLPNHAGEFVPRVITPSSAGTSLMIVPSRTIPVGSRQDYRWDRARSWVDGQEQRLIVPTESGISVFTFESDREPIVEAHQDLTQLGANAATRPASAPATAAATQDSGTRSTAAETPRFLFDPRGLIAWIPATRESSGSNGAARFVDGKWQHLTPEGGWTNRLLHLIPLRDGSVTQLLLSPDGEVTLALGSVEAPPVKRDEILKLVDELADADKDIRNAAYNRLTEYGAGIWPILREIPADDLPPEARSRLSRLLKSQSTPMLGGIALQGSRLQLVQRLRDGGAVFYTDQGVNLPNPLGDDPISYAPAWIATRPGHAVELLNGPLVAQADPKMTKFDALQSQWIVTMDDSGPQQFLGNSFRKLLRKESRAFSELVGKDRRGRWIFRKPTNTGAGETASETLIVDPTLPDFTPRLPVWLYTNAEAIAWDKEGYPVVELAAVRMKLIADRWAPVEEADVLREVPPTAEAAPAAPEAHATPTTLPATSPATAPAATGPTTSGPASTTPATHPSTLPATRSASAIAERLGALGVPLLIDPAGNRYYDGVDALLRVAPDGSETTWSLPDEAKGERDTENPPKLIRTADGRLFLFNKIGRVLRINPTPAAAEPFLLEATFIKDIPDNETPRRIWLDPVGRINMAYERRLAVLFPEGFIPTPIRRMMDLTDDEDEE